MVLLGLLLPVIALAGESARLTIGGVVPPRQRVAIVQSPVTANGQSVTVLEEQNNSALGYTVTVEATAAKGQGQAVKQSLVRSGGQANHPAANKAGLSRSARRPTRTSLMNIIGAVAATGADTVVVTVASQ